MEEESEEQREFRLRLTMPGVLEAVSKFDAENAIRGWTDWRIEHHDTIDEIIVESQVRPSDEDTYREAFEFVAEQLEQKAKKFWEHYNEMEAFWLEHHKEESDGDGRLRESINK